MDTIGLWTTRKLEVMENPTKCLLRSSTRTIRAYIQGTHIQIPFILSFPLLFIVCVSLHSQHLSCKVDGCLHGIPRITSSCSPRRWKDARKRNHCGFCFFFFVLFPRRKHSPGNLTNISYTPLTWLALYTPAAVWLLNIPNRLIGLKLDS